MHLKVHKSLIKKEESYNLLKEIIKRAWKHVKIKNSQSEFLKNHIFQRNHTFTERTVSEILEKQILMLDTVQMRSDLMNTEKNVRVVIKLKQSKF